MPMSFEKSVEGVCDSKAALDERIRALYDLKSYRQDKPLEVAQALLKATDLTTSVLLQHEFLYNVGQIGLPETIPQLQAIILDHDKYNVVSRHEAIESMGAIGLTSCKSNKINKAEADAATSQTETEALDFLIKVQNDPKSEMPIVESCQLAVERIQRIKNEGASHFLIKEDAEFVSVDPAPASQEVKALMEKVQKLKLNPSKGAAEEMKKLDAEIEQMCEALAKILNDETATLWDRYQAMFGLRDIGTDGAVAKLCASLRQDKSSDLFRHEVAFVLGQLENATSSPALVECLKDEDEHPMVRHEAAEALGAVASKADWEVLSQYAEDKNQLVKDSCVVALDMHKYWSNFKPAAEAC